MISLIKVNRNEIAYKTCLIPYEELDIEQYKKISIGQIIHCQIKSNRKYSTHKYFFRLLSFAREHGINEKDCRIEESSFILKKEVIQARLVESGHDNARCWIDIFELLFLPKRILTNLQGQKEYLQSSISYDKLDEVKFKEFISKVENFIADNLEMTVDRLKLEVNS